MNIFLSKYINKIDKKSRVSVPAAYRAILAKEEYNGVIAYQSFKHNCIEVCSLSRLAEISLIIQNLDPYSKERDAFETIVLGGSVQLPFDSEGRVILPEELQNFAEITDQAYFVGKGLVFEIWQPAHFENHLKAAMEVAKDQRLVLKNII